jgi:hypothetical protein
LQKKEKEGLACARCKLLKLKKRFNQARTAWSVNSSLIQVNHLVNQNFAGLAKASADWITQAPSFVKPLQNRVVILAWPSCL